MNDVINHAMPAVGAAVGLFALGVCNDQLPGLLGQDWLGFLSPHLAAVAATLWLMPNAPVSQPKNVVGAHLVVGAVGWLVAQSGMFGDMAGTVSFVLAMTAMGEFCAMMSCRAFSFSSIQFGLPIFFSSFFTLPLTFVLFNRHG